MMDLVTGAGGMIGGHLVRHLEAQGRVVRAVDVKPLEEWLRIPGAASTEVVELADLFVPENCVEVVDGCSHVYDLAENMGGIEHIETHRFDCMGSGRIGLNMLEAAVRRVEKFLFTSSACAYRSDKQDTPDSLPLKEEDAYPCSAEFGYGESKWMIERACKYAHDEYGLDVRVPRLHNVYATHTTYEGGREKAPAAICRKVIEAQLSGSLEIEIYGDGTATRTFMWIEDCLEGFDRLMASSFTDPINLGSAELVTVNQLVDIVENIAGVTLHRTYDLSAPQGVRGRCPDQTLIHSVLDWEPSTSLRDGMQRLYNWIRNEMEQ